MKNDDITVGQISDAKKKLADEIKTAIHKYKETLGEYPSGIDIDFESYMSIGEETRIISSPKIRIIQQV